MIILRSSTTIGVVGPLFALHFVTTCLDLGLVCIMLLLAVFLVKDAC